MAWFYQFLVGSGVNETWCSICTAAVTFLCIWTLFKVTCNLLFPRGPRR